MTNKRLKLLTFKCKKGLTHEQFFYVFEVVLAALIIIALFKFVDSISQQTIFQKNYMARDLAALLNTFYASPGDIVYNYNQNVRDFKLDFADNKVQVYTKQDKEPTNVFYPFAKNNNMQFQHKILNYENENVKIKAYKSTDSISLEKQ